MQKLKHLTKETLFSLYIIERKSLEDIGRLYGVSRIAVYKKLKKYGIVQRSKSEARIEAQKQGKLPQQFFEINENFFSSWTPEMAYVLGLLFTDGCVAKTKGGSYSVSLSLIDKDLLEKVRDVMGSKHPIKSYSPQMNLYRFGFAREKLMNDLLRLGLTKNKSLIVKFPSVPDDFMADFIRGVFDGDGSVFFDKRSKNCPIRTGLFSGSKDFIEKLEENLTKLGLPKRNISHQKTKNGIYYSIRYGHFDSLKLFDILYKNIRKRLFLERKYRRFLEGIRQAQNG